MLGETSLAEGDPARAAAGFLKEIEINPGLALAYYRLGDAYTRSGAWQEASQALERGIWINPNNSAPYILLAKAHEKLGDLRNAEGTLREALKLAPEDEAARQLLSEVHRQSNQPTLKATTKSEWIEDPAARASYLEGVAAYRRHDYVAAVKALTAAIAAMPEGGATYLETAEMIGRSEYLAGHVAAAIPWLEKARTAATPSQELLFALGNCYLHARQIPNARAAFAGIFGKPPDSGAARLFTALMLIRLEFEEDAENELKAALSQDPRLAQAHFMLGEIAIARGQPDHAIDELSREITVNPTFAMAHYRLGDAWSRQEDWAQATPCLQRAVWLNPTYSGPYILLGKAYLKSGDLPEAERLLRRALKIDPQNHSAHYLLGRTLIQSGHSEEGKKLLQRSEELRKQSGQ